MKETVEYKNAAPIIGIKRHCILTDGQGITTLVVFHGCPLKCKYCLNPQSLRESTKVMQFTAEQLIDEVSKDELYFLATGGGITFGGGEPLLQYRYIREAIEISRHKPFLSPWRFMIESSLNVPLDNIKTIAPFIDEFLVDIKDMNNVVYESYTDKSNSAVIENIRWLVDNGYSEKITARVPLIPDYNDDGCRADSVKKLNALGITKHDLFTYKTDVRK